MNVRTFVHAVALLVAAPLLAQPAIRLPELSPKATAGETVGVTDIEISYHRPAVNKRKIWGGLVQYGATWRAGANENTTISFSTPVTVEGKSLAAGTYGLFMIPGQSQWTVVFSKFAEAWGAYFYDPSEDAARVTVTPQPLADNQERLAFTFDEVTNDSATASLRWEKLRVPFKISVDLPATVRASIRSTLRGGKHWNSDAWAAAARWELRNGDAGTALQYADKALEYGNTFTALRTKAAVLEKKGDTAGAKALRDRANAVANEGETIEIAAGTLVGNKKYDEAIKYLSDYIAAHPTTPRAFRVYALIGEAYAGKKDMAKARESFDKAMSVSRDATDREEVMDSVNSVGAEG